MKGAVLQRIPLRRKGRDAASDAPDVPVVDREELVPIADAGQVVGAGTATRASSVLLMTAIALGPVGAGLGGMAWWHTQHAPAPVTSAVDRSNGQAMASAFAQRLVVAWLTSSQQQPGALTALMPQVQSVQLAQTAFQVSAPAVAGVTYVGHGAWSVTVSAAVTDAQHHTNQRWFAVPVQVQQANGGQVSALALPAVVSAPAVTVSQTAAQTFAQQMDPAGPVGQSVGQFLGAYLTGNGDVTRYTTPGVVINPVSPAVFSTVQLYGLTANGQINEAAPRDGAQVRVLAQVTGSTTAAQAITTTYALSLTARASRWEITSIDPAPTPQIPAAAGGASASAVAPSNGTSTVPVPSGGHS